MKNKFISILIAFSLLIGLTATASAASVYTHGGKWSYGVGSKYVWSYYYHGNKGHSSTAIGKYESYSGYTRSGEQSKASAVKAWFGNETYYNIY
ncbi:lactococcin 972 family bacteriocin [Staphylococcus caprae]|uniref:lactococcin 972 family bacteriocin n=1 Tax=Staphylococcus caprae TaxID=29380 RepID=UPI001C83D5CA|nr:lactococcin 972 family bacteriocin [Staphylococcus caprae]MBX5319877.1 lactococcin 972 family bacteriocin [Staphylococcus caprae]MDI9231817.1 lactococcin 972 family bacteriocin [Staphylococcus caprae]MDK6298483.1 lactococcin 972 family bacteriocin [Staphylococcus caprae]MDK7231883.1 lactococcin 972 family bacteriocin [Staphylococcus caprae]